MARGKKKKEYAYLIGLHLHQSIVEIPQEEI